VSRYRAAMLVIAAAFAIAAGLMPAGADELETPPTTECQPGVVIVDGQPAYDDCGLWGPAPPVDPCVDPDGGPVVTDPHDYGTTCPPVVVDPPLEPPAVRPAVAPVAVPAAPEFAG
jgi:hypothetical protein